MGYRIATNVQSLTAQRTLSQQRAEQNHTLDKLSSGERIIRASDDAAGLAISEHLKAEIRGIRQAGRNAQDAISMIQVGEGGATEIGNMLVRMRELSIQGASDTIGDTERGFIDREIQALKSEVQRIADNTKFNGVELLSGNGSPAGGELEFQVGTGSSPEHDRISFDPTQINTGTEALGIADLNVVSKQDAQGALDPLDGAINRISSIRSDFGAMQNRLQSTINNLAISDENYSSANSRVRDADVALETAELTKRNILTQASTATLAQANQVQTLALRLL